MGRIITVASGKGGVGKTTFVSNLASVLAQHDKPTVAVDANLTTPNLGLHLGIPLYPVTLQDVLSGEAKLKEAMYNHKLGFKIIPADISLRRLSKTSANELINILYKLSDGFDYVLIDSAAGLGREALVAIEAADEMITLTNPEMPALVDALKLDRISEKTETHNLGAVVNRIGYDRRSEVTLDEIREFLGMHILGTIPEDKHIKRALANKEPVVSHKPGSPAARGFQDIAAKLSGIKVNRGKFTKIFSWLK